MTREPSPIDYLGMIVYAALDQCGRLFRSLSAEVTIFKDYMLRQCVMTSGGSGNKVDRFHIPSVLRRPQMNLRLVEFEKKIVKDKG